MVLFEKVNTSRPISLFWIQKYFLMRKYISCTNINIFFSKKNRMNKNRKKLDSSILSTVLKLFFENCKQYTYRFFSNHTSIKILWQRLFWFLFFNIQCMYIWQKNATRDYKKSYLIANKTKTIISTQVIILIFYMLWSKMMHLFWQ